MSSRTDGDPDEGEAAAERFVLENYALLEKTVTGPYFFGDSLTVLDIYLWMFINWFETFETGAPVCPKIMALAEAVMNRTDFAPVHRFNFGEGLGWGAQDHSEA